MNSSCLIHVVKRSTLKKKKKGTGFESQLGQFLKSVFENNFENFFLLFKFSVFYIFFFKKKGKSNIFYLFSYF